MSSFKESPVLISVTAVFQCTECGGHFKTEVDESNESGVYDSAVECIDAIFNLADDGPDHYRPVCRMCCEKLEASHD